MRAPAVMQVLLGGGLGEAETPCRGLYWYVATWNQSPSWELAARDQEGLLYVDCHTGNGDGVNTSFEMDGK